MLIEPLPSIHSSIGSEVPQAFKDTRTNHIIAISGFKLFTIDALHLKNIGLARSVEMAFTNRAVTAEEALDWGMVNQIVPDDQLAEAVRDLATKLANGPTRAYGLSKRAIHRANMALLRETL